ncbi:hypothetical protein CLOM_g18000 [Closterium sp. NIES-68]|nr:hypothetical protein CLOM_g18000 [Closterium sp. NIES-68]GJP70126.1 hypothetical protein CLOP_g1107 [Closterium sp. NIES-67]
MSSESKLATSSAAKSHRQASASQESSSSSQSSQSSPSSSPAACDLDDGSWEVDDSWPLYQSENCPFAREETMCAKYGRPNQDYAKLRWVLAGERGNPNSGTGDGAGEGGEKCSLTKITGSNLCRRVAGHRIAFVGDSLSQNAFESMACLMHRFAGMPEVRVERHRDRMYHWPNCNLTVAFSFHQFLSEVAWNKVQVSDGGAIQLDQSGKRWTKHIKAFDTFVINSGHWWSERQLTRYNITFAPPHESLDFLQAYRRALNTTLSEFLHPKLANKQVFFTASAPSHDIHGLCPENKFIKKGDTKRVNRMRLPWTVEKNEVLVDVVRGFEQKQAQGASGFQGARIKLLDMYNVTLYRQEAHPSTYNARGIWDCLHYCLPGVPDVWNEILLWQMEIEKSIRVRV